MAKKRKYKTVEQLVMPKLREASRWWHAKKEARKQAKVKVQVGTFKNGNPKYKTMYRCASCQETFDIKDTHMDHKEPVIDVQTGFIDWNTYISRLFVDVDGYQCLCSGCHQIKTSLENEMRKDYRKKLDKDSEE